MIMKPQVPTSHYSAGYDSKGRFASYWTQIQLIRELNKAPVLEIGVGNKLVNDHLKRMSYDITSIDIACSLEPDVAASVHKIPFGNCCFGAVIACQVLEHLPFELFPVAVSEIARVTHCYAVISLPDASRTYTISALLPMIGKVEWQVYLGHIFPKGRFTSHAQHYWEIGWKDYPVKRIISLMEQGGLTLLRRFRVTEHPYHHFFVLKKG